MVVPSPSPPGPDRLRSKEGRRPKASLRTALRARRHAFVEALGGDARDTLERSLAQALGAVLADAGRIAGYQPMGDEISPLIALDRAEAAGKTIAFPTFAERGSPMLFRAGPASDPGPWGPLQPSADSPLVEPDVVLVPLVAIDRSGNRIGQGQGHYDRALAALRRGGALLIGIGWSLQLVDETIAADEWDVPLDSFACPDGLIGLAR